MSNPNKSEVWRDVEGYEGHYQVSNRGRIKSLIGWNGHEYVKREKILAGWIQASGKSGYKRRVIKLAVKGIGKQYKVHQLVARAFIDNPDCYNLINHIDGNPLNNHIDNLEWCTQKENVNHAIKTGLVKVPAYENEEEIVRLYKEGKSVRAICKIYKSNNKTVNKVLRNNGLKIRNTGYYQDKYGIDRDKLVEEFEKRSKNVDIAKKFGTNRHLIGAYKYNWKKGELIK